METLQRNKEVMVLEALVRQIETAVRKQDPKHVKMLNRCKRYDEKHREERKKHRREWDKAHPERRRELWRRWKAKQDFLKKKEEIQND